MNSMNVFYFSCIIIPVFFSFVSMFLKYITDKLEII